MSSEPVIPDELPPQPPKDPLSNALDLAYNSSKTPFPAAASSLGCRFIFVGPWVTVVNLTQWLHYGVLRNDDLNLNQRERALPGLERCLQLAGSLFTMEIL
jgi:hypothetical protein